MVPSGVNIRALGAEIGERGPVDIKDVVEGSTTDSMTGPSNRDPGPRRDELIDDCDMNEELEGVRTSKAEDAEVNEEPLVGVVASDVDDTDDAKAGTGVRGASGEGGKSEVEGVGVSGIVLKRSTEEIADPVGLRNDVSKEASAPSGTARD
jgi:hypothetical protein